MNATELRPVLREDVLYLGDNGRCFCGRLHHAGASAYFTGRDLSGYRVQRVTAAERRNAERMGVTLACEACGPRRLR